MIMSADYMDARREGREEGRVLQSIEIYRNEMNMDNDQIRQKLIEKFSMNESEASDFLKMSETA